MSYYKNSGNSLQSIRGTSNVEEYGKSILSLSLLKMAITVLIPGCVHAIDIIFCFYKERKD